MSLELVVFLLLSAAVLIAAALLGGRVFGSRVRSTPGMIGRLIVGGAGVALVAWVSWSLYAGARPSPQQAAQAAAVTPEPAPQGDPVPTAISALEDCVVATPPPSPPDGNKASKEDMIGARAAFQQYDAATNSYLKCVDLTIARVRQQFPAASPEERKTLQTLGDVAHNTTIDQEQALADQLNTQVRAFKAKHPGS